MDLKPETFGKLRAFPVEFGRDGSLLSPLQESALADAIATPGATDLLCVSHGWNNDEAEAHALYAELLGNLDRAMSALGAPLAPRPLVLLVYWPSKRFADEELIPGGAASLDDAAEATIRQQIDLLVDAFAGGDGHDAEVRTVLLRLRELLPQIGADEAKQDEFVALVRSIFTSTANEEEGVMLDDGFFTESGRSVLERLAAPVSPPATAAAGGAGGVPDFGGGGGAASLGQAASLGNLFSGLQRGVFNLLNLFTYYEMKERAGKVGKDGLAPLLARLATQKPGLRLHLCGHSFGGRLMASTLASLPAGAKVRSLTLLQAAFSHWGFASRYDGATDGFFRPAFASERLAGPVLVTHTANDRAVGLAYPLASRLRRQVASGLGDANDPYGGIGRNGAQKTPEVDATRHALLAPGVRYGAFQPGHVYNLEASPFIANHGDVRNPAVAHALASAMLG